MNKGQSVLTVAMWMAGITLTGSGLLYNAINPKIEAQEVKIYDHESRVSKLETTSTSIEKILEAQNRKLDALLWANNINPSRFTQPITTATST